MGKRNVEKTASSDLDCGTNDTITNNNKDVDS